MEKITAKGLINDLYQLKSGDDFIKFQERIINTNLKIIGVKVPNLRKLAQEYYKSGKSIEFNKETDKYFEAVLLEGLLISFEKDRQILKVKLESFFKKMDNWAVVDMVSSSLLAFKKEVNEDDFAYFKSLLKSNHAFTVRFGVVCLFKFFSKTNCNDKVLNALEDVVCGEYYVDMAIAWLISELIVKNTQNAIKIMKKVKLINNFNRFIVNKSVQKVCDSYRISEEIKNELKKMRIK